MKSKSFFRFFAIILANLFVAVAFASGVHQAYGYDTMTVASVTFLTPPAMYIGACLAYSALDIPFPQVRKTTALCMAIQVESWVDYIINNLFKENSFVDLCDNDSDNVLNGTVVHIPQAGAKPVVVMNRSSFPGTAVRRTDTDVTYALDVFSTDPTHITKAEEKEISCQKQESVLGEHRMAMGETSADQLL